MLPAKYLKQEGSFKTYAIETLGESKEVSEYYFSSGDSSVNISFIEGGDRHHFPIALSSLFGKYIREVFMHHQNRFFQRQAPSLRPASGYRDSTTKTFVEVTCDPRREMGLPDQCFLREK